MPIASPFLTDDRLRAVLDACGYRGMATVVSARHSLPAGCAVALQFGDKVEVDENGHACLTVQCGLRVSGENGVAIRATHWQLRKSVRPPGMPDRLGLAIKADLILDDSIGLADICDCGGSLYRHLRALIADARATLQDTTIDSGREAERTARVVRVEARMLGDLAAGRSGLAASPKPGISARQLRMNVAMCDWLSNAVLPDIARALRILVLPEMPSVPSRTRRLTAAPSDLSTESWLLRLTNDGSVRPAHESLQ